jgi:hypothetical protein
MKNISIVIQDTSSKCFLVVGADKVDRLDTLAHAQVFRTPSAAAKRIDRLHGALMKKEAATGRVLKKAYVMRFILTDRLDAAPFNTMPPRRRAV